MKTELIDKKNIKIRNIEEKDYRKIYEVIRESFWNLYRPGCEEHLLAKNIFESKDYISNISFLIEYNGETVGCILYTKVITVNEIGKKNELVSFGPVCILPKFHRQGLGRMLINHSLGQAKKAGYKGVIIAGYRYHYECYGFTGAKKYNMCMPDGNFYYGIMALPLTDGGLCGMDGKIYFADCMQDSSAAQIEEFDKDFEPAEKKVLPSHKQIEAEVIKIDED